MGMARMRVVGVFSAVCIAGLLIAQPVQMRDSTTQGARTQGPATQATPIQGSTTQAAEAPKPVTVVVVDAETKKPVPEFEYFAQIQVPSGRETDWRRWMPDRATMWMEELERGEGVSSGWVAVRSADGTFLLDAPGSCQIALTVSAPGYVTEDRSKEYQVKQADRDRRLVDELQRGTTLRGKVVDRETAEPVKGVQISPRGFRSPTIGEKFDWPVGTDEQGQFEIGGISWGVGARHPDFLEGGFSIPMEQHGHAQAIDGVTIRLQRPGTMTGVVRDSDGHPIAGAWVSGGFGPDTQTGADGSFVLGGMDLRPEGRAFTLGAGKEGFIRTWREFSRAPREKVEITLRPLFEIRGRVFDPEGRPVQQFTVMAGQRRYPPEYKCASATVNDAEGRFTIGVETDAMDADQPDENHHRIEREHWVGVKAEGFGAWEGWVTYSPKVEPLSVTLSPGAAVSGRLTGIGEGLTEGEAVLIPVYQGTAELRLDENAAQRFATLRMPIGTDGRFRFEHVRPGKYTLIVGGKGITPKVVTVEVPPNELDVGAVEVVGVGRVEGQAFTRRCEPWAFGRGEVHWQGLGGPAINWFTPDENGCFVLEGVPAGKCSVGVMSGGGCMVSFDNREVEVRPGETTRLVINDPETGDVVRFHLVVGDGSEAQRRSGFGATGTGAVEGPGERIAILDLEMTRLPEAAMNTVERGNYCLLDDGSVEFVWGVSPGEYRVRLYRWEDARHEGDGVVYEGRVTVERSKQAINVQVGAGAIKGKMAIERQARYQPKVLAVEVHGRTHVRRVQCSEEDGSFCLRYLPPGEYALFAHKETQGWCRLPPVKVENEVVEVSGLWLKPGGVIRGSVVHHQPTSKQVALRMTEASGAFVEPINYWGRSGEEFMVENVWPGEWMVRAECEGKVIAEEKVRIEGTETVRAELGE